MIGHFLPSLALDFSMNNSPLRNIIPTLIFIITWGWLSRPPSSCTIICGSPLLNNGGIQVSSVGSTCILLNSSWVEVDNITSIIVIVIIIITTITVAITRVLQIIGDLE